MPLATMPKQPLGICLWSERCLLRPAQVSDLPNLVQAFSHSEFPTALPLSDIFRDGELSSWLGHACQRNTSSHSAVWAIDLPSGESSVGQIAIVARELDHVLSFWLSPPYWGNGLAREAVSKVIEYVFSTGIVKRIWAGTAQWNEPSARLMLTLGFAEDSVLEAGYTANGVAFAVRQFHLQSNHETCGAPNEGNR